MTTATNTFANFDFQRFNAFCSRNGMNLLDPNGDLTVQGQAVMETSNCVVAAGAGSGKTTVLSFRFLRMVAQGISPERILTITFTKKATAEMKSRIYELLQKGHEEGLVSDSSMAKFAEVSISTVDSFCSEVVRASAVHQGVPSSFRIMDDDDLERVSDSIVRMLLNRHYNEPVVQRLYSNFSVENLNAVFLDLARNHLNITRPIDVPRSMDTLKALVTDKIAQLEDERLNAKRVRKQPTKEELFYMNALHDAPFMEAYYGLVCEYEEELFSRKRTAGALSFNDVMQLAIRILKDEVHIRDRFKSRFDSVMVDEFQDNNDDYRKLIYLLCERQYIEGAVRTYDSEGIPDLQALSKNKIFLVGDEKQSIYRFRGADVSVFKRLSSEICTSPIELRKNWRSEPAIIHFCNHAFPTVMENFGEEDYEASYIPLEPRDAIIPRSRIALLHPDLSNEDATAGRSNIECEANVVAQLIADICSGKAPFLVPDDSDKTLLRPPRPNEIGLLLKVGSHQAVFEKALTAKEIPYTVSEARSLVSDSVANDFYSALQACTYTYDRISYVAYLKSPFCSLSDSELQVVLDEKRSSEDLPQMLSSRIKRANDNLASLFKVASAGSICRTLDYMWYDMGYRGYMLSRTLNRPYADHFDYLYALAVDYDAKGQTLVDFLDYLRPLLGRGSTKTKEVTVFKENVSGVQIMTVHKSKGLAFKVAIVADMHSGAKGPSGFQPNNYKVGDDVFLSYEQGTDSVGAMHNPVKDILSPMEKGMENAETKRILYVAATRARYHLVFSGCIDERTPLHPDPEKKNVMLTYLLHSIGYDPATWTGNLKGDGFELEELCMEPRFVEPAVHDRDKTFYRSVFESANVPILPNGIVSRAVTQLGSIEPSSEESHETSRRRLPSIASDPVIAKYSFNTGFGTLVHKLIEDRIKGLMEDESQLLGMLPEKADEEEKSLLFKDARSMADSFMTGRLYDSIRGKELLSEKRFIMFDGTSFIEGAIDLLAVGEDCIDVIDFKTDSTCAFEDHKAQLGQYVNAVSSMYNQSHETQRKIRAFVCYLRDVDSYLELSLD